MKEYKTKEQKAKFYGSYRWRKMREMIIKRDQGECQVCKENGLVTIKRDIMNKKGTRRKIQLLVHHLLELEHHPELALEPSNLLTVCVNCHNLEHNRHFKYSGFTFKRNRFADDERFD